MMVVKPNPLLDLVSRKVARESLARQIRPSMIGSGCSRRSDAASVSRTSGSVGWRS